MTVASSSVGIPRAASLATNTATSPSRFWPLLQPRCQEPFEEDGVTENVRCEQLGNPVSGQFHQGLVADDTGVHDERIKSSIDGREPSTDRTKIGDVHENDVEDVSAGDGLEIDLCR